MKIQDHKKNSGKFYKLTTDTWHMEEDEKKRKIKLTSLRMEQGMEVDENR